MNPARSIPILLALGGALTAAPLAGQQEHADHAHDEHAFGDVLFPVSCAPDVQPAFVRAVAVLHSFGYEEARRRFRSIAEADPECGMAHWGIAMTYFHPLWAPPTPEELAAGREAAAAAARVGAGTARERAYIDAIGAFYRDSDRLDHRTRAIAYRDAMARLARAQPEDDEAAIFHALGVLGAAPPSDPSFAEQKRAAEILNRRLSTHPRHPGILHYTIHAFDYPALAELALPAARAYAAIAPESPHALHMPTHIFTRLGLWRESIESNRTCAEVAEAQVERIHPGADGFETLHCLDYLVYAHLQLGEDSAAREALERVAAARRFDDPNFAVGYAVLSVPARYALERRDWAAAAALERPRLRLEWQNFRQAEAILHFANAVGAARLGDVDRARAAVDALDALHAELARKPPAGPYDWPGRVESMRLAAAAWLAHAEGRSGEAVELMRAAAEKEESVGKHPVTPGPVLPARELLGDLLLALARPAEALAAYEAALEQAPRRFNSVAGAARAARAAGDAAKAGRYYAALLDLAGAADGGRAAVAEARAFLDSAPGERR